MRLNLWGRFFYLFSAFVCFFLFVVSNSIQAQSVENLRCNFLKEPIGLDAENISFSWEIVSPGQRNISQASYQVLVATEEALLDENSADCWNSGLVNSSQSVQVKYEGATLVSCKRYYWKVKVKLAGDDDPVSSASSFFETGILSEKEWQASWISAPSIWSWPEFLKSKSKHTDNDNTPWDNRSPMFRKDFQLKKELKSARLYISGLGYYEAYLNGKKVGDRYLDPAFTRYDKTILYATYDITHDLVKNNAIGIMLGNGWFNLASKAVWGFDHAPWRGKPRAIVQVMLDYKDGSKEWVISDEKWRVAPAPVTFNSIRQGMIYNANLEQEGWDSAGFDEKDWLPVTVVPSPGGKFRPQLMDPIREWKKLAPVKIEKRANNRYLVDFGQNLAGWINLKASGEKGDTITVKYGEEIVNDSVFQENIKVFTQGFVQTDQFILSEKPSESFETKFTYHGFQFVEILNYPGELKLENIRAVAAGTDFKERGTFACSDTILNRLQRNTIWSFRSNYYGYPTDCPQREKNGWTGDAQIAVETGLWNFDSNLAYAKYLQDMLDEQQANGDLPAIIPSSGWGYYQFNGPDWIGAYIIIPWQMYLYDGDKEILTKHYEGMKSLMSFFTSKAENYILSYGLGDHTYDRSKRNVPLTSTAYYYQFARILTNVAKVLGNENDRIYYADLSENIKAAFNAKFFSSKTFKYGNGGQTNQSCPVFMGLAEPQNIKSVIENLADTIRDNGYHIDAGILGAQYVPIALSDYGKADVAYKVITNKTFPGWGWWIEQGATTLWEEWDGLKRKPNASYNHIMFGDISNWCYRNVAGIKPDVDMPGFKHFFIEPKLTSELNWSKAGFDSNYGKIKIEWEKTNGKLLMSLEVPCNTTATVVLPVKSKAAVKESGKILKKTGLVSTINDTGKVAIEIGSGTWQFECDGE